MNTFRQSPEKRLAEDHHVALSSLQGPEPYTTIDPSIERESLLEPVWEHFGPA